MFNVVSYKLNADNLKKADVTDRAGASNALHAAEHDAHHEEHHSHILGHIAHAVAEGLGVAGKALHVVHKHLPGVLHHIEHVAEVYAEIAHNETSRDETENVVCGTVVGMTKIVAGGSALAVLIMPGLNEVALPFVAEEVGVVIIALASGATLQYTVDAALKPCADLAKHSCHTAFANYHRFNRELAIPKIKTIDAALHAINPSQNELAEEQNPVRMTCTKDRSTHRFVTPNYVSMRELEKQTTSGTFLYVLSEKEKLVIAKQEGLLFGEAVSHIDLARGKPVYAAGMIKVEQGKIVRIDNQSTDYQYTDAAIHPDNDALMPMFEANGVRDIHDKWVATMSSDLLASSPQPQPIVTKEEILPQVNLYKNPALSSASFFTHAQRPQARLTRKAPLYDTGSSIDFAARKAHFSSLIANQGSVSLSSRPLGRERASVNTISQPSLSQAPSMFRVHHVPAQRQSGNTGMMIEITQPGRVVYD